MLSISTAKLTEYVLELTPLFLRGLKIRYQYKDILTNGFILQVYVINIQLYIADDAEKVLRRAVLICAQF